MPLTPLHFPFCFHNPSFSLLWVGEVVTHCHCHPTTGSTDYQSWRKTQKPIMVFDHWAKHRHCGVIFPQTSHRVQTTNTRGDTLRGTSTPGHYWQGVLEIHDKVWWKLNILMNENHVPLWPSTTLLFPFLNLLGSSVVSENRKFWRAFKTLELLKTLAK